MSNPKPRFRPKSRSSLDSHLGVPSLVRFSFDALESTASGFLGVLHYSLRSSALTGTGNFCFFLGISGLAVGNRRGSLSFLPKMSLPRFQYFRTVKVLSVSRDAEGFNRREVC